MRTTAMLVEYLVIGIFSFIWSAPLALKLGLDQSSIKFDTTLLDLALVLAVVYFAGMLISLIADILLSGSDALALSLAGVSRTKAELQRDRYTAIAESSGIAEYLFVRRSQVRVFRANTLNFLLALIMLIYAPDWYAKTGLSIVALGVLIFLTALICWWGFVRCLAGYYRFVTDAAQTAGGAHEQS